MTLALNLLSLFLSIVAVAASTVLLIRQTSFMRHANELPVSVELYAEYRTIEFQEAQHYVLDSLGIDFDASLGISKLPNEVRAMSNKVASFYSSLGALVNLGLADERFMVSLLGSAAERAWMALEPFIIREREIRGNDEVFAFFEDLVSRTRENFPLTEAYGITFRRIATSTQ